MKQIYSIPFGIAVLLLLEGVSSHPLNAQISPEACQTVLHDRVYEQMCREALLVNYPWNIVQRSGKTASTDTVPVFFTVFRNDDGTFATPEIDAALTGEG